MSTHATYLNRVPRTYAQALADREASQVAIVRIPCPECHGPGVVDVSLDYNGYKPGECWTCRGKGHVEKP